MAACCLFLGACTAVPGAPPPAEPARQDLARELAAVASELDTARAEREALAAALSAQREALAEALDALGRLEGLLTAAPSPPEPLPAPACEPCELAEVLGDKQIVGRREQVWIEDLQLALPARIDTGAETASLDARNIREFERDGDDWVRFDIVHPQSGEPLTLERPVVRVVRILQSTSEEAERRAVIELGIVLGEVRQMAEFTLSDRSHLDFQMLVGRNILKDLMIVDVSQSNIAPYRAPDPESQ